MPRPQAALPGAVQHRRLSGVGLWGVVGGEHLIYFLCFSEGAPRPEIGKKIISCPQCSVSCGEGQQTRRVLCRDARGDPSTKCEPDRKPPSTQPCRTGIDCPKEKHELDDELKEGSEIKFGKFFTFIKYTGGYWKIIIFPLQRAFLILWSFVWGFQYFLQTIKFCTIVIVTTLIS